MYPSVTQNTVMAMRVDCVNTVPLLFRSCCFPVQRVCRALWADGAPSLVGRWAGRDPRAGNTRPEQTSLLGQITQWFHVGQKITSLKRKGNTIPLSELSEIITLPRNGGGMWSSGFVCYQGNSKSYWRIWLKCSEYFDTGTRKKW